MSPIESGDRFLSAPPIKKPWLTEAGGAQLEAFLGSRGMRTSAIGSTEELIQTAAGVFELPMQPTCRKMADLIDALGPAKRKLLALKNIGPSPHLAQRRRRKHRIHRFAK